MTGPFVRIPLTSDCGVSFCWINVAHVASIDPDPDRPDRCLLWHTTVFETGEDGQSSAVSAMRVASSADAVAHLFNEALSDRSGTLRVQAS